MEPALETLLSRLPPFAEQFRDLRDGVQMAIDIAARDPEMALTRSRKVLERIVREVYERRCNEPPGSRPLENLLQRLVRDGHLPTRLDAYANTVRMLGNVGTHRFGEGITTADVYQSLSQLLPILEWYCREEQPDGAAPAARVTPPVPTPESRAAANLAVVPKGLRSFDAGDARFFLQLLPGPRDENGLPESIRFWKHRIEDQDTAAFTVGVLYGPSGCGKSSLLKAGLLPRLAPHVRAVYVEATAADTEARLLKGLRKQCPELPGDHDLTATLLALRRGQGVPQGQKSFLVLDQFEQWLHARRGEEETELAQALRQCDGDHVQCLVLVRDDFWLPVSRFMQQLQIELVQGQNLALVDLFDLTHARAVLAAFGRAFGRIDEPARPEQTAFLDQAVAGLAQDCRVISVRLALCAEMVKSRPWTPATLKEVGGAEGVGVAFLEETFSATGADPRHRLHQQAARAVLQALLPEQGTDIKGTMQSYGKLLEASGYGRRPRDFEELLRLLDSELRLLTPTAPTDDSPPREQGDGEKYYQLTHDYLVPSLREWLTRKQKETRRGRAELRLAERTAAWTAKPEKRHLPAWWEWLNIRLFTRKQTWTPSQRKMMRQAKRFHATRGLILALVLAVVTAAGLGIRARVVEANNARHGADLVHRLLDADTAQVPGIVAEMNGYREWTDPLLREEYDKAPEQSRQKLHTSLALLPVDPEQKDYLYRRLLDAEPHEVPVLRDALAPYKQELVESLWLIAEQPTRGKEAQRLRAAAALAAYDPQSPRWAKVQNQVTNDLVAVPAVYLAPWIRSLRPVREQLLTPLTVVFRDGKRRETERTLAANVLADYAADQPPLLADLLLDATDSQFAVLFPVLQASEDPGLAVLLEEVERKDVALPLLVAGSFGVAASPLEQGPWLCFPGVLPDRRNEVKEDLAKRQANAAVGVLRLGRADKVWPLLEHSPDPRLRSYLIHRFGPLGADAGALIKRLDEKKEVSIQRALVLSLGEYGPETWSASDRDFLVRKIRELYQTADDAGLHAAAEWLLRQWKQEAWLQETNAAWRRDEERQKRAAGVRDALTTEKARPQWYVNSQGLTMVVIPRSEEPFLMGSPLEDLERRDDEDQHLQRIGRSFALAAKPVTVQEYLEFDPSYRKEIERPYTPDDACPVNYINWYMAAAYCNWLSKREGLDPCYETVGRESAKLKANYLRLNGYRLPTEAEMEYACRAGAGTSRYYGGSADLLKKYAWYLQNSAQHSWPVGLTKPNDWGLFDMHGNVWCWCEDKYGDYPKLGEGKVNEDIEDIEDIKEFDTQKSLVLRGGSFDDDPRLVRCALRYVYAPAGRLTYVGFRPARTCP